MTLTSLRLALVAGLALPLGLATATLAQDAPPPAPQGAGMHEHHWDPAKMREHMAEHLRAVLQLTPAQDPALNAFLDSMKPPADMKPGDHEGEMEHLTTPQRLDKMTAHLDQERAHIAAVRTFYAQLSPSQQTAFDAVAPMMMHDHGMHGGHHDGHDGPEGHHHGGMDEHPMGPGGPPQG